MSHPNSHLGAHKLHTAKKHKKKTATIDSLAYVIGIGGNIAVVPQIIKAWSSDAPGLAVITWVLFSGCSVIWLVYAVKHKQKPLVLAQATGLTCNLLVISGWFVNNTIR